MSSPSTAGVLDDVADVVAPLGQQVVDGHVELVGAAPQPTDRAPCGSGESTRRTLRPPRPARLRRLIVVVVLPTPPFWLHIAMTRAGPWALGAGSGK